MSVGIIFILFRNQKGTKRIVSTSPPFSYNAYNVYIITNFDYLVNKKEVSLLPFLYHVLILAWHKILNYEVNAVPWMLGLPVFIIG